jgi:drug/metabolite transporter (DMT)-like permease
MNTRVCSGEVEGIVKRLSVRITYDDRLRVFFLTAGALIGFSANSLLTRSALGFGRLDPASFTAVRLATGALTLAILARLRAVGPNTSRGPFVQGGSWRSAVALAGYAIFFTLAYARIGAAVGAMVLFGSVQVTMIGVGLVQGERPSRIDWAGLALAVAGLLTFALRGATSPDLTGTGLMAVAGASWGAYSLAGRGSRDPLGVTAGNFLRAALFGTLFFLAAAPSGWHLTSGGLWLAAASGSIASGAGYTLWYAALPALGAWRAAVVQLIVPVFTALCAAVLLDEAITLRLAIAATLVAAGVGLTTWPSRHRPRA